MRKKQGLAKTWLKGGVLVVGITAGLVAGIAGPAAADPTTTYVAVGSDTTQDVMDGFAANVGGGAVGSWDAVNPATSAAHELITPKAGCVMTRPNGSGEGLAALRKSINTSTAATQLADPPEAGCVDFARSSGGPGANASATGALVYIPFALDAVAIATGPATAVTGADPALATAIAQANNFTTANLTTMYTTCAAVTVGGITYTPDGTVTNATNQPIHLYIPQAGSGTRSFWATTMGFSNATPPTCVHDHSVLDPTFLIEEHNGLIFANDPAGFGPFSIAQFVSQGHGHNDRRHNVALHNLNTIAPLTAGGALNTAFPITREVYNIALFSRVTAGGDPTLTGLLAGGSSAMCSNSLLIGQFGFATLSTAPLGHTCGQIVNALRAFDPATNPV